MKKRFQVFLLVWLLLMIAGFFKLVTYSGTAGKMDPAPTLWPADSRVQLDLKLPTLVMFVHPHCACSKASLYELDSMLTKVHGKVKPTVVFYGPEVFGDAWVTQSDLWRQAQQMPGVDLVLDNEGVETRLFKSATSGHVLMYHPTGRLLFSGGITSARGHSGDNLGKSAITSLIFNEPVNQENTPVFGCPILDHTEERKAG